MLACLTRNVEVDLHADGQPGPARKSGWTGLGLLQEVENTLPMRGKSENPLSRKDDPWPAALTITLVGSWHYARAKA